MKTTRAVPSINSWLEGRKDGYGRKGKTHQTKTATPRRNWNQELARVLRDLPRGTPVTVRFSHILRMEWSVDADTMPEGFCEWLRQTRKELAPFFTIAARDLRQYLVSVELRRSHSTIHRLFIMDMADTPTAQRHNADIKVALRAFATYQTVKHHPLARDAARLWWQAPAAADAKKRLINAMASATWEDGRPRSAPASPTGRRSRPAAPPARTNASPRGGQAHAPVAGRHAPGPGTRPRTRQLTPRQAPPPQRRVDL